MPQGIIFDFRNTIGRRLRSGMLVASSRYLSSPNIQIDYMAISFESLRLVITEYETKDAEDLFYCISPAITTFMPWEPPRSVDDLKARRREMASSASAGDFRFVIRSKTTAECLGASSIDDAGSPTPEVGIWLRETVHGLGYAGEVIKRLCEWDDGKVRSARIHLSGSGRELAEQAHCGTPRRRCDRTPHQSEICLCSLPHSPSTAADSPA